MHLIYITVGTSYALRFDLQRAEVLPHDTPFTNTLGMPSMGPASEDTYLSIFGISEHSQMRLSGVEFLRMTDAENDLTRQFIGADCGS